MSGDLFSLMLPMDTRNVQRTTRLTSERVHASCFCKTTKKCSDKCRVQFGFSLYSSNPFKSHLQSY